MAKTFKYNDPQSKELAFNGKLKTNVDGIDIGANDFQILQNLRYTDTNVRGILGHTKINTSPLPDTAIRNGIQFRKGQPVESHVVVDANGKCYDNTTAIPNQGGFGSALYTDPSGATTGRYAIAPTGMLARCTGKEALLWGGTEYRCGGFIDYPAAGTVYNYIDQISNTLTDAANLATLATANLAGVFTATFYVGSNMPIDGVKFYVTVGSGVASSMSAKYWNGTAWVAVGSPSDGTSGFQNTGNNWFTFTSTASTAKQSVLEKEFAYWYQFTVIANADYNAVIKISHVTVSVPMQKIQDFWDGQLMHCASFILNINGTANLNRDETAKVLDSYMGIYGQDIQTYARIGSTDMNSNGYLIFGFQDRARGISFSLSSEHKNTQTCAMNYLAYWNGSGWIDITSTAIDGTSDGTSTMNHSGWITWQGVEPNYERSQTSLPGHLTLDSLVTNTEVTVSKDYPLYYYKMGFDFDMSGDTCVYYAGGIRAQTQINGYTFADQYAGRLMLCDNTDGKRNTARYSSYQSCNVFNGMDSDEVEFGGDEPLVASASIYNRYGSTETNTWVVCKKNETWILSGDDPTKWVKFRLSGKIGCIAPLSMKAVNLSSKDVSQQQVSTNAVIWVSATGVRLFIDGSILAIDEDISDLFDPSYPTYLGVNTISSITAFYDDLQSEYHMVIPGVMELVWDALRKKWFTINRGGSPLYGGFYCNDSVGYQYSYGYGNNGYVYRLENGTTFDGEGIAHILRTGDMALPDGSIMEWSQIDWFLLVAKAKAITAQQISMEYFNDTGASAYGPTTISPSRAGYRIMNTVVHNRDIQTTFHGFQFSITTTDEQTGFEPLFLGIRYRVFPREVV